MTPRKRQIKYELEQLELAFRQVREALPDSALYVGLQLQRIENVAYLVGLPWDKTVSLIGETE